MEVSRSAYYNWLRHPEVPPRDEELKEKISALFQKSRNTYGSRRLVKGIKEEGYSISRFKVRRLMKELRLEVRYPKRYKVTTAISYCWTLEGFVYVATVMDLYSRQIVGWSIDDTMKTS